MSQTSILDEGYFDHWDADMRRGWLRSAFAVGMMAALALAAPAAQAVTINIEGVFDVANGAALAQSQGTEFSASFWLDASTLTPSVNLPNTWSAPMSFAVDYAGGPLATAPGPGTINWDGTAWQIFQGFGSSPDSGVMAMAFLAGLDFFSSGDYLDIGNWNASFGIFQYSGSTYVGNLSSTNPSMTMAPVAAVPLPAGVALLGAGVAGLGLLGLGKRRSRRAIAAA
ncbi:MAG: hypothetical protein ACO1OG_03960 [Devosia sp.]